MIGMKALWVLGKQFWIHMFKRLFRLYKPGGRERFLLNFREDRILPLSADTAALVPGWQRCTGCGLCDLVCPILGQPVEGHGPFSVSQLVLSGWRDFTAVPLSRGPAELLAGCGECGACESACPERVPIKALAAFVVETAEALDG